MVKLILLSALFAAVYSGPTKFEVETCNSLNVIKKCPTSNALCQDQLNDFQKNLTKNKFCIRAQQQADDTADYRPYPSDQFVQCYNDIQPTNQDETFSKWYFIPLLNCAQYGNPYYQGSEEKQQKINEVAQCQATSKKCDDEDCLGGCEYALKQYKSKFQNECALVRQNFLDIVEENGDPYYPYQDVKVTYPFSMRSCNVSLDLGDNEHFKQIYQCWQDCAQPLDEFEDYESSQISKVVDLISSFFSI